MYTSLSDSQNKNLSQFWLKKSTTLYCLYYSSFLNYNFFQTTLCEKQISSKEVWIISSLFCNHVIDKNCSQGQSCLSTFHFVISQNPDKIFQPFRDQKWCPNLAAPKFGVNFECFAQKVWIRSKTPNFGVNKNSGYDY